MIIYQLLTREKLLALTFDDGPHVVYTPQVLEVLNKYDAKATFFVIGAFAKEHPELVLRLLGEGHEVGNHTYTHPSLPTRTRQEIKVELERTNEVLQQITGAPPKLFRPPYGEFNKDVVEVAEELGHPTILWPDHQNTKDWSLPGAEVIARHVLANLQSGDIVLFHDGSNNVEESRTQTVQALEILLPQLVQDGYKLVTVSQLIAASSNILVEV